MATEKQKQAARRNLSKARAAQSARAKGKRVPRRTQGMSTADQNDLAASEFAFPEARKEPLTDAAHVRNAIARFDQVEGVGDADRDQAWKRIKAAAKRFDVDVEADDWRELFAGGKGSAERGGAALSRVPGGLPDAGHWRGPVPGDPASGSRRAIRHAAGHLPPG